jgi:hypothetical protein
MNFSVSGRPPLLVLRVLLVSASILFAFAGIVCVVALVLAWHGGESGPTTTGALAGSLCALIAFLFITIFHLRRETIVVPLEDRQAFLRRLGNHLEELGYAVAHPAENMVVGRPAFHALLFGGRVEARLASDRAILSGPRVYLEVLRRRLPLHAHLEQVPHALSVQRSRHGEPMLRSVQIKVQVPGRLLAIVYNEVASVMAHEGVQIECELCIRGRAENGFREQIVDAKVHDWLKEHEVPVEIQKEPFLIPADV